MYINVVFSFELARGLFRPDWIYNRRFALSEFVRFIYFSFVYKVGDLYKLAIYKDS